MKLDKIEIVSTDDKIYNIKRQWQQRGFSCDLWTDRPGARWEDFTHEVDELLMVIDGEVELEIEGNVSWPEPFEEVLIPANAVHSVRNVGKAESHWLYGYKRS